jgi:hypothetical protein
MLTRGDDGMSYGMAEVETGQSPEGTSSVEKSQYSNCGI